MRLPAILILLFSFLSLSAQAQKVQVSGKISDSTENKNLQFASVSLLRKTDSVLITYTRADKNGNFSFAKPDTGDYVILITFPKFADYMDEVKLGTDMSLGNIFLTPASKVLDAVIVRTTGAIRIKGDTTEFVADSFKVKEGGTVEDLLKKLPGLTINSKGEIQAQGKRVDKVLVDGEEFFGDDPTMATQNISAKAVDRVQIFDTKTEQQKITGITTGSEGKTVNIKLKEDAKKGAFGKIIAGTDFNKYFDSKAFYNNFKGRKKVSVYGTRSNINTGSLNWEDRQKLGIENDFEYDELSGYYFSFGGGDEFADWSLRGLPDAWTGGALFSNKWGFGDKNNMNVSYRYNRLLTTNNGTTFSQNILPTGITYTNKYSKKSGLNQQHAINGKYEWKLDSFATFKIVVVNTFKNSHSTGSNNGEFLNGNRDTVNQSFNGYNNNTKRHQTDHQFTYKQLFKKKNRLWQTVVRYGVIDDENDGLNLTRIRYFDPTTFIYDHSDTVDQQKLFDGRSTTRGIKTTFTEPISDKWMLALDYSWNNNESRSLRNTYKKNIIGKYEERVPEFSNNFRLNATSNTGNVMFRFTDKKVRLGLGMGITGIGLDLDNLDSNKQSRFHFTKFTPQASANITPKAQFNIGVNYRGNSIQPTISQLQPLRDNTDELNVYIGNPDLKVGFNHSIGLFLNQYKVLSQSWIGLNFNYSIQQNAITQFNTIDVTTGKRTNFPVNINGNQNWNLWMNYNKSKGNGKPNYGFGFSGNGSRYNNFVNSQKATTRSFNFGMNLSLGIEKEDVYEFNLSPNISYNHSKSSLNNSIDNNYYSFGGWGEASFMLPGKIEFENTWNVDISQKLDAFDTNNNQVIWNSSLNKDFFKKDKLRISLVANDVLNQNKGFSRTINSNFISEDRYKRIGQYFLLKLQWSFTKSPGGGAEEKK